LQRSLEKRKEMKKRPGLSAIACSGERPGRGAPLLVNNG
jgi:hypothetical protein